MRKWDVEGGVCLVGRAGGGLKRLVGKFGLIPT